jgi:hypothetical protein
MAGLQIAYGLNNGTTADHPVTLLRKAYGIHPMTALTRADLYTLETYAVERSAFRTRVLAHKQLRKLHLGEHVTLLFEDRLTIQYQVQEMLRIERIFEAAAIQDELDAYNPLIPGGSDLKATMLIEYADEAVRRRELARLGGIEHHLYAEVAGHGRATTHADEDLDRSDDGKTSAVHFLRFAFTVEQISSLRAGATLCFGIDDPRMPVEVEVPATTRESLMQDFTR